MGQHQQFVNEVEGYLAATKMNPTRFGREAISDPNFVFELRRGRSPVSRTMDKVREFMQREAA
tara:strand:+ start:382 stop:570 length:189 start_codon:yes stop_codon:yes gene_type:complete